MTQQKPTLEVHYTCRHSDKHDFSCGECIRTLITAAKEEGRTEERNRILEALPKKLPYDIEDEEFWDPERIAGYNQCLEEIINTLKE